MYLTVKEMIAETHLFVHASHGCVTWSLIEA